MVCFESKKNEQEVLLWLLQCSPSFIRIGNTTELGEAFKHLLIEVKVAEVFKVIKVTSGHPS